MKKTLDLVAVTFAAGFLCAASLGVSAEGMSRDAKLSPEDQQAYSKLDTNGDGKISQQEAQQNPQLAAKFSSLDKNSDNMIEEGEFARFEVETKK